MLDTFITYSGGLPASCPLGARVLSEKVKWLLCEANLSPPSSAEFKVVSSYTSTP